MAEAETENTEATEEAAPAKKGGGKSSVIALVLFLVLSGGAFYATYSGIVPAASMLGMGGGDGEAEEEEVVEEVSPGVAFVSLGEIVVPLGPRAQSDFLILEASIEVAPEDVEALETVMPRIRDLFNTYLRAVEAADLEAPNATMKLRAQLLRRLRVVTEPAAPRDLLFTSFILR